MSTEPGAAGSLRYVGGIEQQAGALAYVPGSRPLRFLLVTSRRTGRWVFPKGSIDPGNSGPTAAAWEALEEGGVVGIPDEQPIGRFRTAKIRAPLIWIVEVEIFPMRIDEMLEVWIEADRRQRRLVTLAEAGALLKDPGMMAIAERFATIYDAAGDRH